MNAAKSRIRIAVSVYVPVAIIKKRLKIGTRICTVLQILQPNGFQANTSHSATY